MILCTRLKRLGTRPRLSFTRLILASVRHDRASWFRLTAPPGAREYPNAPTHQERERLRRAGLASIVAPILSLSTLLLVQQASDPGTRLAMLLCVACPLLALLLFNRRGHPVMAALLIAGCMEIAIEVALLTTLK